MKENPYYGKPRFKLPEVETMDDDPDMDSISWIDYFGLDDDATQEDIEKAWDDQM